MNQQDGHDICEDLLTPTGSSRGKRTANEEQEDRGQDVVESRSSAREQREARRRRILAKGADRLAYITGDKKSLEEQGAREASAAAEYQPAGFEPPSGGFVPGVSTETSRRVPQYVPSSPLLGEERQQEDAFASPQSSLFGLPIATSTPPTGNLSSQGVEQARNTIGESAGDPFGTSNVMAAIAELLNQQLLSQQGGGLFVGPAAATAAAAIGADQSRSRGGGGPPWLAAPRPGGIRPGARVAQRLRVGLDKTSHMRLGAAICIALLVLVHMTASSCNIALPSPLQALVSSWPLLLVVLTSMTLVLGKSLTAGNGSGPSQPSGGFGSDHQGPELGPGPGLAQHVDALQDPLALLMGMAESFGGQVDRVLVAFKASTALVADVSVYLVTLFCGASLIAACSKHLCSMAQQNLTPVPS
eukprot:jgi/Mesen1/5018/ME000025S04415